MSIHLYYDLQYVTDDGKCINKNNISYSEIMNFSFGFDGYFLYGACLSSSKSAAPTNSKPKKTDGWGF